MDNYIELANKTNTVNLHEGMPKGTVLEILRNLIETGETLDAVKKFQFYGRKTEETQDIQDYGTHMAIYGGEFAKDYMTEIDFESLVPGLSREDGIRVYHAIIGGITEAVELGQALVAAITGEKPLDPVNLLEETGDGLWYSAGLLRVLGKSFADAQVANIAKLNKRYPNGEFNAFLAQQENRNLVAEHEALSGTDTP